MAETASPQRLRGKRRFLFWLLAYVATPLVLLNGILLLRSSEAGAVLKWVAIVLMLIVLRFVIQLYRSKLRH